MIKKLGEIVALVLVLFFVALLVSFGWSGPGPNIPPTGTGIINVDSVPPYKVGIGVSPGLYKLDINAGGSTFGFHATGTAYFSDKLGIGTANPAVRLHLSDGSLLQATPTQPLPVGLLSGLPNRARALFIAGRYAYVGFLATSPYDFAIVDFSNPGAPSVVGTLCTCNGIRDLYVAGRYAYATTDNGHLIVIDVSRPSNPAIVMGGDISIQGVAFQYPVFASGKYAYVTSAPGKFFVIDISNPASPSVVNSVADILPAEGYEIYASGRYVYVSARDPALGTSYFRIVDVSNPASPQVVGGSSLDGAFSTFGSRMREIFVSGRYAYLVFDQDFDGQDALRIIDVSDANNPTPVTLGSNWPILPSHTHKIFVSGRYAFTVSFNTFDPTKTLRIIDIGNPQEPKVVGGQGFLSSISVNQQGHGGRNISVSGRYAYISESGNQSSSIASKFEIVDITGLQTVSANLNALEVGSLQVRENAAIGNNLLVKGGLTVGSNALISGNLSKGGGNFLIDHPLDPLNKVLRHSFVESPDMKNIYDGIAILDRNGEGEIKLPDYFEALNKDFRYQFSGVDGPIPNLYVKQEILKNKFIVAGGPPYAEVSWQVTGIRKDRYAEKYPIIVEEGKALPGFIHRELYLNE